MQPPPCHTQAKANAQLEERAAAGPEGAAAPHAHTPVYDADALTFALNRPWLRFSRTAAAAGLGLAAGGSDDSDDSWEGLPCVSEGAAAGCGTPGGGAGAAQGKEGGEYPHFDPEVVEEMRQLNLLPPKA